MYCKNCGKEMNENQEICLSCGVKKGEGSKFCQNCGKETAPGAAVCLNCGIALNNTASSQKEKLIAGLLAIFLGEFGIHNFYLGYTKKAIIQLVICILGSFLFGLGTLAVWIWAIIEAVQIFQGKITDANGNPLK